jgi:hypothetical protein
MRLAAQLRGGFYPAAPAAIAQVATFLRPPRNGPFAILDPCAGEGAAIRQLARLLGCPPSMTFAIELDEDRADKLRAALPEGHVLAPANFFGCHASANSFSFTWLNPPFDTAYGGHRVEIQFLRNATDWLMAGGVMALVCPEDVISEHSEARRHFATYFEHCQIVPFPERHRPFQEVVVLGHKRLRVQAASYGAVDWSSVQAPAHFVYELPKGSGPRVFEKVEPTEPELQRMLAQSPLREHLTAPAAVALPSQPLVLGTGHVALLLASGHLDGVVQPEGKPPHVVRGTCRKRSYVADVTETENADGSIITRTTIAEKIELMVRTVDLSGTIRTFAEEEDNHNSTPSGGNSCKQ